MLVILIEIAFFLCVKTRKILDEVFAETWRKMGPTGQFILLLIFVSHELPRCHCIRCYMCTHNTGVPWDDKGCVDVDQHDMTHHLLRACPPFPPNHVNFNKCIFYKLYSLALNCFVCLHDYKGQSNPNCLTVESSENGHGLQAHCPDVPSTDPKNNKCSYIKIINSKGEIIVMERACGILEEIYTLRLGCKTVIGPTYSTMGCLCEGDGCNGSTHLKISKLLMLLLLFVVTVSMLFIR